MTQNSTNGVKTAGPGSKSTMFKVGNPGGPGRPKGGVYHSKLTTDVLKEMIDGFLLMSVDEIKERLDNTTLSGIEHIIMSAILAARRHGDIGKIDILLNRLIGKLTDKVEIKIPKPHIIEKLDGTKIELGSELEPD